MRVLIRTLPLHNANYGGILQNWALQHVLRELGAYPVTDTSTPPLSIPKQVLKDGILACRSILPATWNIFPGDRCRFANRPILDFIDKNIDSIQLFSSSSRMPSRDILKTFDAFIVGSDQVWRKDYGDVSSYLMDFLGPDDPRPRIAYAASLGAVDMNIWTSEELDKMTGLLQQFNAVSLRERQGSEWCHDVLGVRSQTMPDPTLLVLKDSYEQLFQATHYEIQKQPYLLTYLLNPTDDVESVAGSIATQNGLVVRSIGGANVDGRPRATIPEWLHLFHDAAAVVTDSFHGMVFSTLFNRPFSVIPNVKRGVDRFDSFVELYSLEDHVASGSSQLRDALSSEADWASVNNQIAQSRQSGMAFISQHLGLNSRPSETL